MTQARRHYTYISRCGNVKILSEAMTTHPFIMRLSVFAILWSAFALAQQQPSPKQNKTKAPPTKRSPQTEVAPLPTQTETEKDMAKEEDDSDKGDDPQIVEVLFTKEYVEFSELDPIPPDVIQWDKNSGRFLYISKNEPPFIFLMGALREGYELSVNNKWVKAPGGVFEVKINVPLEPTTFNLRIVKPNRSFTSYRLINYWLKIPPALRFKIQEGNKIVEKVLGFSGKFKRSAFTQLYSAGSPITVVDLDSQKHANLTFRLYYPPDPEEVYDGWTFVIRNSDNRVVGQMSRYGSPPPFIDWREVANQLFAKDTYSYQINLYKEKKIYEGPINKFETIEGLALLNHEYLPKFQIEPKAELGYFDFKDNTGTRYQNLFVGADLGFVLYNRFIARGLGQISLHSVDPNNSFTYTRIGGGLRFFGDGDNAVFGHPHIFHLDILVNHTGYTTYPTSKIQRFSHISLLVEPHLVLWAYHYFVPWVEYGARAKLDQQRISLGLQYYFFVRPWSVKVGLGVSYDNYFRYDFEELLHKDLRFQVFRALASFIFFL